jgi:alpha-beta hydrolase superfamily lysophospholipase
MYYLAREVAKTGIAALTFDWRGTRKSVDEKRGEVGINLPDEERNKIFLDVKAAVDLLASQDRVDGSRLGLLASTATNNHAIRAAMGDSRIKTMVGLSFYAPAPDVKQYLQTAELPLFIIASTEDVNADGGSLAEGSKEVYEVSNSKQTEFILFDNAGRSTGMLKTNPELVGMINRWFKDKLAR